MAKVGINAFLLDCRTNENISEIEAEYGVKGFAVVVRLWQKIYFEKGYYCEWSGRSPLLFLSDWFGGNSGVTCSLINEIVDRCLNNGIFHAEMYEKYSILTSARIQSQYFDVVKRREEILVKKEYLLISVDKIKGIVYENFNSVCRNEKNVYRSDTSKVKESKVKESKVKQRETVRHIEDFISTYPKDCNRFLTEQEYASLLLTGGISEEELVSCAKNYAEECRILGTQERFIKSAHNFLKDFTFEKYLPGKYAKPKQKEEKPTSKFHNFQERSYDMEELEKALINR